MTDPELAQELMQRVRRGQRLNTQEASFLVDHLVVVLVPALDVLQEAMTVINEKMMLCLGAMTIFNQVVKDSNDA